MTGKPVVLFSLDLEDHTQAYGRDARLIAVIEKLLPVLSERKITGTFFTVGQIAKNYPALLRRIADAGHEIACHSMMHVPLTKQNAVEFSADTATAKAILEDVSGQAVNGYRAPIFSLTRSVWRYSDILHELGFQYSSSVLGARNPLHGFPGAPETPFRWPSGLVEIPCPLLSVGNASIPFLGGMYFRYLPWPVIAREIGKCGERVLWNYCHPYDFDGDEGFVKFPDTPLWGSLLLSYNRKGMLSRLIKLYERAESLRFTDWLSAHDVAALPTWGPDHAEAV